MSFHWKGGLSMAEQDRLTAEEDNLFINLVDLFPFQGDVGDWFLGSFMIFRPCDTIVAGDGGCKTCRCWWRWWRWWWRWRWQSDPLLITSSQPTLAHHQLSEFLTQERKVSLTNFWRTFADNSFPRQLISDICIWCRVGECDRQNINYWSNTTFWLIPTGTSYLIDMSQLVIDGVGGCRLYRIYSSLNLRFHCCGKLWNLKLLNKG